MRISFLFPITVMISYVMVTLLSFTGDDFLQTTHSKEAGISFNHNLDVKSPDQSETTHMQSTNSGHDLNQEDGGHKKLISLLEQRRQELDDLEETLRNKQQFLDLMGSHLDKKVEEMRLAQEKLDESINIYNEQITTEMEKLAAIYENMKPDESAKIFENMDIDNTVKILRRMRVTKIAPILAKLSVTKARELSVKMTYREDESILTNGVICKCDSLQEQR